MIVSFGETHENIYMQKSGAFNKFPDIFYRRLKLS